MSAKEQVANMPQDIIYLDNAATTMLKPPEVADAITSALSSFGGVGRGVHPASIAAGMAVFGARDALAQLLNAPGAQQVSFTSNATMALNIAIDALLHDGKIAVTTAASHNSVLRPLFKARDERGCAVRVAPIDADGGLDYEAYEKMLPGADLVAVTHASNLTGDIYDIARMTKLAHEAGALVVLDAAQTAGCYPIDMEQLDVDVICVTGHKALLGPQGTGALCVRERLDLAPLLEGGSGTHSFDERHPRFMPEALEAGTLNAHGLAGLAAGIDYIQSRGLADIVAHEGALASYLSQELGKIDGIRIYGGGDAAQGNIVAFNIGTTDSALVADQLANDWGICTRAGAHCAPLMHKALGTQEQGAVRASFGPFNKKDDADTLLQAVKSIADQGTK